MELELSVESTAVIQPLKWIYFITETDKLPDIFEVKLIKR